MRLPPELADVVRRNDLRYLERGHRHGRIVRANGSYVTAIPRTPSDHRWVRNALSHLRQLGYR